MALMAPRLLTLIGATVRKSKEHFTTAMFQDGRRAPLKLREPEQRQVFVH
jgi:hypothetical protein